jgi:drug/metabolite transporter (DMT)-like permease
VLTRPGEAILAAVLATTAYHLGLILEKRALGGTASIDARHPLALVRTVLSTRLWMAGFALMVCGLGLQVVALTLAPVSVVQPVLGSGVVILVILSRIVLRERLGRIELACLLLMTIAIAAIAVSAAGQADQVGRSANGLLLVAVTVPACVVALAFGASSLRATPRGRHRMPALGVSYGISSGLLYGVAALAIKALSGTLARPAGARGGFLFLVTTLARSPYPYLFVCLSAVGLLIFQTGLQRCRVSIVGPVSNITGSVFFMVVGTWLFAEQLPTDPAKLGLRIGGFVLACLVVTVLSRQTPPGERVAPKSGAAPVPGPADAGATGSTPAIGTA